VHQAQGRHQRVRRAILSVPGHSLERGLTPFKNNFVGCPNPLVDLRRIRLNPRHGKALATDDEAQEETGRDVRILDFYLPIFCEPP
jgi:hypothetical protein